MIYLYVPFNNSEENAKLLKYAQQWRKAMYVNIERPVSCAILSASDGVFDVSQSATGKTKIYILAYVTEDRPQEIASSSSAVSPYTINAKQLAERLLSSGLPTKGQVEIKLCIRQNAMSDTDLLISVESLKENLLKMNYLNLELLIRIERSSEPFPGEISKFAYHSIGGSVPLLFCTNKAAAADTSVDNLEMDIGSGNMLNLMRVGV